MAARALAAVRPSKANLCSKLAGFGLVNVRGFVLFLLSQAEAAMLSVCLVAAIALSGPGFFLSLLRLQHCFSSSCGLSIHLSELRSLG